MFQCSNVPRECVWQSKGGGTVSVINLHPKLTPPINFFIPGIIHSKKRGTLEQIAFSSVYIYIIIKDILLLLLPNQTLTTPTKPTPATDYPPILKHSTSFAIGTLGTNGTNFVAAQSTPKTPY